MSEIPKHFWLANVSKALARAVYSRKQLLLLDDTLSAVDAQTQRSICIRLLSREELLYKHNRTVIITTHSSENNASHIFAHL